MPSLLAKLRAQSPAVPAPIVSEWAAEPRRRGANERVRSPVCASSDVERVLALPRRPQIALEGVTGQALVELVTARLRRDRRGEPCACASMGRKCIDRLQPGQAWALYEAPIAGGLFGPIGVGHGKTLLDILMAIAMDARQAVLLIPPTSRDTLHAEYLRAREHFRVPSLVMDDVGHIVPGAPVLHVVPYSILSRPESTELLERLAPDLIIADEGHRLRHRDTAGTGRLLRWLARGQTKFCTWSGTFAKGSIKDFAHLAAFALGAGSPLPIDPDIVEEWAAAVDPSDAPAPPGVLKRLLAGPNDVVEAALHRRLVETCGVVATRQSAVDASINLLERKPAAVPVAIGKLMSDVRGGGDPLKRWVRPDGEELVDAVQVAQCLKQLACGFYYRWRFPRGESEELIEAWFEARKAWHRELRVRLSARLPHLDSPMLCANAAARAYAEEPYEGELPVWHAATWPAWAEIKDAVYHEIEAVWVDDYLVRDAVAWAKKHRGIVWYEFEAFGKKVAELGELALHGGGQGAEARILSETGKRSIVASIKSHGAQRDGLQRRFREQLVANPPASGDAWEQLLGRLHRMGQEADEVDAWLYRHTPELREAVDRAVTQAKWLGGIMGTDQKLLNANCNFELTLA